MVFYPRRVWEDVDRDGIQDHGEPGMAGIRLRLTDFNKNPVTEEFVTDENGIGTYPAGTQSVWYRVEVLNPPSGAIPTRKSSGTDGAADSDMNADWFTDHFRIEQEGDFTTEDVGISLPGSVQIR